MATTAIAGFEGQLRIGNVILIELTDCTLNIEADQIKVDSHTSGGWKSVIAGLKGWTMDVKAWHSPADTTHIAIRNALIAGTPVSVDFRPQDSSGKDKFTGTGRITKSSLTSPSSNAAENSFTINGDGPITVGTV